METKGWNLFLYGAAVDAPFEIVVGLVRADPYLVRHVLLVFVTLFGLAGTYLLGARLGGRWLGLLAAALLAASPRFFAHGSFNHKDIPFAVFYVWSLFLLAQDLKRAIGSSLWHAVPLGFMVGLLMGTRVGGVIVLLPIAMGYAARWWMAGAGARKLILLGARFSLVVLLSWGILLLSWPWAQLAPLVNPMTALVASTRFLPAGWELFGGRLVRIEDVPLSYLPVWLSRTLPDATLMGLGLIGFLFLFRRPPAKRLLDPPLLSTLVAVGFPLAWVGLSGPNLYDGPRHFFFLQPLIALGAAAGILGTASRLPRWSGLLILGAVGSAGLITIIDAFRLHPYEHVYFNRVTGGLPAAAAKFELDYWGLSYREGAEWLNETLGAQGDVSIASCSGPVSTSHFLSDDFRFLGSLFFGVVEQPDYVLYTALHDCGDQRPSGELVHEVTRSGVSLLKIIRPASNDPVATVSVAEKSVQPSPGPDH